MYSQPRRAATYAGPRRPTSPPARGRQSLTAVRVDGDSAELMRSISCTVDALRATLSPDQFQRCKISPDRLRRPKLLFLLRIVNAVADSTGFGRSLYDDAQGRDACAVIVEPGAFPKDRVRAGKIEYFDRLQQAIVDALGEAEPPAFTRSIITGGEPDRTNLMLQKLCQAASAMGGGQEQQLEQEQLRVRQEQEQLRVQREQEQARLRREQDLLRLRQEQEQQQQQLARQEEERRQQLEQEQLRQQQEQLRQQQHFQPRPQPRPQEVLSPKQPPRTDSATSLAKVKEHATTLSNPALEHAHEASFDALIQHIYAPGGPEDISAKSLAAEMLHTNNHRFPHKKDELVDALLALDDEITVHEIQAQQGKSEELADWLSAAPAAVQSCTAWPDLKQQLAGGATPPAALLFSALDKDGDGVITRDEMLGGFAPAR